MTKRKSEAELEHRLQGNLDRQQVAEALGNITKEGIRQIELRAFEKLRKRLKRMGIEKLDDIA